MKNLKLLSLICLTFLVLTACTSDDTPKPVNEEELITTVKITLTPSTAGHATVTLESKDLDGDKGPNAPTNTVVGNLVANQNYTGTVQFLNETKTPAEDVTKEVKKEDTEHQVFFTAGSGLNVTTTPTNLDSNSNPLGTEFTVKAGAAGSGTFTIILRHKPTKPNTGLANAGGSTDVERTFNVTVQ